MSTRQDLLDWATSEEVAVPRQPTRADVRAPGDEAGFRQWWNTNPKVIAWRKAFKAKYNEEPSPDVPEYDYRAAFRAGVTPESVPQDDIPHWSSQFKADDHPTRFINRGGERYDTREGKVVPGSVTGLPVEQESTRADLLAWAESDALPSAAPARKWQPGDPLPPHLREGGSGPLITGLPAMDPESKAKLFNERFTDAMQQEAYRHASADKIGKRPKEDYERYAGAVAERMGIPASPRLALELKPILDGADWAAPGNNQTGSGRFDQNIQVTPAPLREYALEAYKYRVRSQNLNPGWLGRTAASALGGLAKVDQTLDWIDPGMSAEDARWRRTLLNSALEPVQPPPEAGAFSRVTQGIVGTLPQMAVAAALGGTPGIVTAFGAPTAVEAGMEATERGAGKGAAILTGAVAGTLETMLFAGIGKRLFGGHSTPVVGALDAVKAYAGETLATGNTLTVNDIQRRLVTELGTRLGGGQGKEAMALINETVSAIPDTYLTAAFLHAPKAGRQIAGELRTPKADQSLLIAKPPVVLPQQLAAHIRDRMGRGGGGPSRAEVVELGAPESHVRGKNAPLASEAARAKWLDETFPETPPVIPSAAEAAQREHARDLLARWVQQKGEPQRAPTQPRPPAAPPPSSPAITPKAAEAAWNKAAAEERHAAIPRQAPWLDKASWSDLSKEGQDSFVAWLEARGFEGTIPAAPPAPQQKGRPQPAPSPSAASAAETAKDIIRFWPDAARVAAETGNMDEVLLEGSPRAGAVLAELRKFFKQQKGATDAERVKEATQPDASGGPRVEAQVPEGPEQGGGRGVPGGRQAGGQVPGQAPGEVIPSDKVLAQRAAAGEAVQRPAHISPERWKAMVKQAGRQIAKPPAPPPPVIEPIPMDDWLRDHPRPEYKGNLFEGSGWEAIEEWERQFNDEFQRRIKAAVATPVQPPAKPPAPPKKPLRKPVEPPAPPPPVVEPEGVWQGKDARGWTREAITAAARKLGILTGGRTHGDIISEARGVEAALDQYAKDRGLKPQDFRQAVDVVLPAERERRESQRAAIKAARDAVKLTPSQVHRLEENGKDRSNVKGFDETTQELQSNYPGLLTDPLRPERDPGDVLWDLLKKKQAAFRAPRADDPDVLSAAEQWLEAEAGDQAKAVVPRKEASPEEIADANAKLAEAPDASTASEADLDLYLRDMEQRERAREPVPAGKPIRKPVKGKEKPLRVKSEAAEALAKETADLKSEVGQALAAARDLLARKLASLHGNQQGTVELPLTLDDELRTALRQAVVGAAKLSVNLGKRSVLTFEEFIAGLGIDVRTASGEVMDYLRTTWELARTRIRGNRMAPLEEAEVATEVRPEPAAPRVIDEAEPAVEPVYTEPPPLPPRGAPPAAGTPPPLPAGRPTSIKNAAVDELRADRGLTPLPGVSPEEFQQWLDEGQRRLTVDPSLPAKLITEIMTKPRVLDNIETAVMQLYYRRLNNELGTSVDDMVKATSPGDKAVATAEVNRVMAALEEAEQATKLAGTEAGRALAARKIELLQDYSLTGLIRRATAAKGAALDANEVAVLEGLVKQLEGFQKRIDILAQAHDLDAEIAKTPGGAPAKGKAPKTPSPPAPSRKEAASARKQEAWEKLKNSWAAMKTVGAVHDPKAEADKQLAVLRDATDLARAYVAEKVATWLEFWAKVRSDFGPSVDPLRDTFRKAWNDLASERQPVKTKSTNPESVGRLARKLTRAVVEAGITDRETVVDQVHEQLQEIFGPTWERQQTIDAICGYGRFRELSKEDVAVEMRRISGELQQQRKIEDLTNAIAQAEKWRAQGMSEDEIGQRLADEDLLPKKTGIQRRETGPAEADLIKEVNELKKQLPTTAVGNAKSLKTAQDAAITAAKNRLRELDQEIATGQRIVKNRNKLVPSAELTRLRELIAEKKEIHRTMFPKAPLTDAQLAARAAKVLERTANRLEADLQAGRLWPGKKTAPKPTSPEYEAAKARIEDLRATRDDLRAQQDPNRAYRQSLEKRLAELQERIDNKDFAPKSVRKERQLSADERDLLYEYDQTKQKFREMQEDWRWDQRTKVGKVVGQAANTLHASRAVITAFDASAVGRQGGFAAMAHPVLAGKAAAKMVRTLTKKGDFAVAEELRSRGNYQNGLYAKAKLALTGIVGPAHEEVYAGRWTKKIPGVAVSERIYRSFLNCLRAEMFDAMIGGRTFKGTASIEEARAVAAFVNAATGRGGLGVLEVASKPLAEVFFAPRFVVSRFQLIASPFLGFYAGKGTSLRVRRAVATEYARTLTTAAMMYGMVTLAGALFYDDKDRNKPRVTFDPRSSDFGKIVIGKTRLDPLGGLSQATVLLARTIKGETRPIGTRKVVALRGKKRPFGSPTWVDVVVKFGRSKLSPAAGMAINWQQGENLIGESVTYGSMLGEATIPLSFRDIYEAMQDQGVPKGAALGLISLFGVGLQTYQPRRHKRPARR